MIYSRRALQRRISELRGVLGNEFVDKLVHRLNVPGKDRMAAMWETIILHALSRLGTVRSEIEMPNGKRPDIVFEDGALSFVADVVLASDDALDEQNPYYALSSRIEALKGRLGLGMGGMDMRVQASEHRNRRGTKTVLRLPEQRRLDRFVRETIEPELRRQIAAGETVLHLAIDDAVAGLDITIDPRKSPYNSGSYAAYDVPTIKDSNPLYNALKRKASEQLKGIDGLVGIIVGDAGCTALSDRRHPQTDISARAIIQEFLRQYSSIGFVVLLSTREKQHHFPQMGPPDRWNHCLVEVRKDGPDKALDALFGNMITSFPRPARSPVNGALRAAEKGYGWGHHGGHSMSGSQVRISARELMEVLAGRRTVAQFNEINGWRALDAPPANATMANPFDLALSRGKLPAAVRVTSTDEDDSDDWIEIEFGDPDPAIAPIT